MSFFSKVKAFTLLGIGASAGAAVAYFLDPDRGRTRRAEASQQIGAALRDQADAVRQQADFRAGQVKGAVAERVPTGGPEGDAALKSKVESEVLSYALAPKGSIVVEARDGTVILRGEVPSEDARRDLLQRVRSLEGVSDVTDLTHLPGETAPNVAQSVDASG